MIAVFFAGCGGGGSHGGALGSSGSSGNVTGATVGLRFTIPAQTQSAAGSSRRVATISASTQSIGLSINGASQQFFNVAPPQCTGSAPITCTFTANASVGYDSFVVTAYSGTNGSGSILDQGAQSVNVTASGPNPLQIVLSPPSGPLLVAVGNGFEGFAQAVPVTVIELNSSGNPINGSYPTPVTLTNSDTSGVTSLNTTTVTSSTQQVTLQYSGAVLSSGTTIAASEGGATNSVTFQPNADNPLLNGANETFTTTLNGTGQGSGQSPMSASYTLTSTDTLSSAQSFNGLSGLIGVGQTTTVPIGPATVNTTSYLMPQIEGMDLAIEEIGQSTQISADSSTVQVSDVYTPPYALEDLLPHLPATLSPAYAASTETISSASEGSVTFTNNIDGSYSATGSISSSGVTHTVALQLNSNGSASGSQTSSDTTGATGDYKDSAVVGAPTGSTISITLTEQVSSSSSPVSTPLSVPNWLPSDMLPSPMLAQTVTDLGAVSLPGSCTLPEGYPSTATDVRTVQTRTDPILAYMYTWTIDAYSVAGVGTACIVSVFTGQIYNEFEDSDQVAPGALLATGTLNTVSTLASSSLTPQSRHGMARGVMIPGVVIGQVQALRAHMILSQFKKRAAILWATRRK